MKFDFSKYDKKWRWFAVDEDGSAYLYTAKPSLYRFAWASSDDLVTELEGQFDNHCWYYSLQEREDEEMEKLVNFLEMEEGKNYTIIYVPVGATFKKENGLIFTKETNQSEWVESKISVNTAMKPIFKEYIKPVRIPDETTPIDTIVRVRMNDSQVWRVRRFASYLPKSSNKFWCFDEGKYRNNALIINDWKYCEIIEEGDN